MAVSLSVKDVPDHVADALRQRAAGNRRSLQGELLHILETSVGPRPFRARELWEALRQVGLPPSPGNESVQMIREDRDR